MYAEFCGEIELRIQSSIKRRTGGTNVRGAVDLNWVRKFFKLFDLYSIYIDR
jgi:hypothetical protein